MISQDGAVLQDIGSKSLTYAKTDGSKTPCRFEKARQLWSCDDGTVSGMTVAGLPFNDIVLIEFDQKTFTRK